MIAKALWYLGNGRFSLEEEELPEIKKDQCLVKSLYSGISLGTERLVYSEQVPDSMKNSMKCPYMGGEFPFPIKYGYSTVGQVIEGPKDLITRIVHLLHPHQNYCLVKAIDVFPFDSVIPSKRAILATNFETVLNALWDARVSIGDKVLVVGFGNIGSLLTRVLSFMVEIEIIVVDTNKKKLKLAKEMGVKGVFPDQVSTSFDIVFHTSANESGLQTAIESVGFEGKVIELSWYGKRPVSIQLGTSFHIERKTVVSSQVSHISPSHRARWDNHRRKELVFSLLRHPEFDQHLTHINQFQQLPETLTTLQHHQWEDALSCLVCYNAEKEPV